MPRCRSRQCVRRARRRARATYLFVAGRDLMGRFRLRVRSIAIGREELKRQVDAFAAMLQLGPSATAIARRRWSTFCSRGGVESYGTLCLVPDGPLWNLPFAALIGQGRHFVERHALFYALSIAAYETMIASRARPADTRENCSPSEIPRLHRAGWRERRRKPSVICRSCHSRRPRTKSNGSPGSTAPAAAASTCGGRPRGGVSSTTARAFTSSTRHPRRAGRLRSPLLASDAGRRPARRLGDSPTPSRRRPRRPLRVRKGPRCDVGGEGIIGMSLGVW